MRSGVCRSVVLFPGGEMREVEAGEVRRHKGREVRYMRGNVRRGSRRNYKKRVRELRGGVVGQCGCVGEVDSRGSERL